MHAAKMLFKLGILKRFLSTNMKKQLNLNQDGISSYERPTVFLELEMH